MKKNNLTVVLMFAIIIALLVLLVLFVTQNIKKENNTYINEIELLITNDISNGTYYIMKNGNLCKGILENQKCDGEILEISISTKVPDSGFVTVQNGLITNISLIYGNDNKIDEDDTAEKICKVTSGTGYNIGDVITCAGENFYVLENDEKYIRMLSMYNLDVGYIYDPVNWDVKEIQNATGIQSSNALGFVSAEDIYYGVVKYSSLDRVNEYIKSYENYLKNNGVNSASATLISYDKLKELGCKDYLCTKAPSFIYSTTYCTSTGTGYDVWTVSSNGNIDLESYDDYYYGIRPVVSILVIEI